MTSADVDAAAGSLDPDADLVVNICASLSDATARPRCGVGGEAERTAAALALLGQLGAQVEGPAGLVMTSADVDAAAGSLDPGADLVVNICASFSDATPALRLYRSLPRP